MKVREKLVELPIDDAILVLREEHRQRTDGYTTYLAHGGKGDPAEEVGLDALAMAISALEKTKWISVNDRLPEDDLPKDTKKKMIRCLVYTNKGTIKPCVRQRWEVNGKLVPWQWNKDLFAKPTHWMYYPQPPKGE